MYAKAVFAIHTVGEMGWEEGRGRTKLQKIE